MPANPSIVCDPAASWYGFAYSLSWSNECEVAEVLSDIPLISVGILVFGVSALFLVMRRVSLSAVWLFSSTLLAFIAAVLDLGKILAAGMAINTTLMANAAVIRAREVLLALSIGFRFLFYWSYVAEPPRKQLPAVSTRTVQKIKFLNLECIHELHSWMRWGLLGKLLAIGLLIAIITIVTLQIVWRVVPQFHQYSNIYGTDAALELLVSFLLFLRLSLNTLALNTSAHTIEESLVPISGLLVNIAIGVGGLLCFAFTESTVGRLLQAFEVYVIVVFVVITAFLKHRDILLSATPLQDRQRTDAVFTLPEPARGSTFRITPPLIDTPRMSMILSNATQNKESSRETLRRSARRSLNRVSSWVSSKIARNRAHCDDEEVRLWSAERAQADPPYTGIIDIGLARRSVLSAQKCKELGELLRDAPPSANHVSIISALDAQSAHVLAMENSIHSDQSLRLSRASVLQCMVPLPLQTSSVPVSSVPSPIPKYARSMATTPEPSLFYGLSAIQPLTSASDSQTSLDKLLRQQKQLDQSAEALELTPARTSGNSLPSDSVTGPRGTELARSPSTGQRTISSEVSLSNFPIPPWLTTPVPSLPTSFPTSVKRIRGNRRAHLTAAPPTPFQDAYALVASMSSASLTGISSLPSFNSTPHTPLKKENKSLPLFAEPGESPRTDPEGTQYNVTSFIDGRPFDTNDGFPDAPSRSNDP